MYIEWIKKAIDRKGTNEAFKKAVADAELQINLYKGENLDSIITDYRKNESQKQKEQRTRITIGRSKHIIRQIANVFDYLKMMDTPVSNIITKNPKHKEVLEKWVYDNNIHDLAFNSVKMNGALVDANAWMVATTNDLGEIAFKVLKSECLYDIDTLNGITKGVLFKTGRMVGNEKVYDYSFYHQSGIIEFKDKRGSEMSEMGWNEYYISETKTEMMLAFCLGYISDETNTLPTKVTTIEAASELFRALLQLGSDADTVKATHGIIQKFAYARKCNYRNRTEEHNYLCVSGKLVIDGNVTNDNCPICNGTGLDIHTSSQDIITIPIPDDPTNMRPLSDMVHTVNIADGILNFNRDDLLDLRAQIMETVFNSSIITKDEIAATATEKVIDLQGVYATLNTLGKHVSNCFIWMVECKAWFEGFKEVAIIHGYTLSLKLESVETLSQKRKTLIEANAPIEVIKAYDLMIIQKQHIDSPAYVNRFIVWEQYRPFSDKSANEISVILSGLPQSSYFKVLYNFWGHIKRNIELKEGDKFFDYADEKRQTLIDAEVAKIQEMIKADEPQRSTFNDIEDDTE